MELFDKRFVYFMWDDELEGKKVFASNDIYSLMDFVNYSRETDGLVKEYGYSNCPFITVKGNRLYQFVYYDPNYEVKRAFYKEGKQIQVAYKGANNWVDCDEPEWVDGCQFRVKPECPCEEGIDSKACAGCPQDEERKRKRIEERASKFGEVCVHPEYDDEKCKKCNECIEGPDYRPFKDCDELVEFWSKNYQTGFRPAYTKPLIWVRLKCDGRERLIVAFGKGFGTDFVEIGNKAKAVTLQRLFDDYEFLDGCVIGVKND